MNAAETIQAAIEKLERLKAGATPGRWLTWENTIAGDYALISEQADEEGSLIVADYMDDATADLVSALHRTVDAQLAILQYSTRLVRLSEAEDDMPFGAADGEAEYLDLARAILGETP